MWSLATSGSQISSGTPLTLMRPWPAWIAAVALEVFLEPA
jgi:hypothetical protein